MNIHPQFITLLTRWENYILVPQLDRGNPPPWVVGYGHTNANNYPPFVDHTTVLKDEAEARAILIGELNDVYAPQLRKLFQSIDFKPPNDLYFCGFLDVLYNRGAGRLAGADAGSKLKGSYAWHILKNERNRKNWLCHAANALVLSHVEDYTPLDTAYDKDLGAERVFEGLTGRRACDAGLCLWERF